MKKKLAIIGSGISGLISAYILNQEYDIEIYEKNDYIGGHTHTVKVDNVGIDTGFIVFNNKTYPNFKKIIDKLKIPYQKAEMSFSVNNKELNLEYKGHNLNTLFSDRFNIFRPKFYRLIFDILKFNKIAKRLDNADNITLGEFLQRHKFGNFFTYGYILPMGSAIWSMGIDDMLSFPTTLFCKFFNNHGLLNIKKRPEWYTIQGGSSNYIPKLIESFINKIHLSTQIQKIVNKNDKVVLKFDNNLEIEYDAVICACHSDQALLMIDNPTPEQKNVLCNIQYSKSLVTLHTDTNLLPKFTLAHASWNYLSINSSNKMATLTYNMNILQNLNLDKTYCVTLNADDLIDQNKVIAKFEYEHPIYSIAAVKAQNLFEYISGVNNIYFCGAYWANGFHEDGVNSAIRVAKQLGVDFV